MLVALLAFLSPAFGLAVADFFGATFLTSAAFEAWPFLAFFGLLSDSDADEAELRVFLVVGSAFVLGLRDGVFFGEAFFLALLSELEVPEDPELLELDESESLELSSLPDEEDEDELPEDELPDEELPEEAEDEALLEPGLLGGI